MRKLGLLLLLTASAYGDVAPFGTRSTDDTEAARAEASLSGYRKTGFKEVEPQKQEAQNENKNKEKSNSRGEHHEKTRD